MSEGEAKAELAAQIAELEQVVKGLLQALGRLQRIESLVEKIAISMGIEAHG